MRRSSHRYGMWLCAFVFLGVWLGSGFAISVSASSMPSAWELWGTGVGDKRWDEEACAARTKLSEAVPGANQGDPNVYAEYNDEYTGFLRKIVVCIQTAVAVYTSSQFAKIETYMANIFGPVLILYLMFILVKFVLGDLQKAKSELIVKTLILSLVIYVVYGTGLQDYMRLFFGAQEALVGVMTQAIPAVDPVTNQPFCNRTDIWEKVDCLITYVMGIHPMTPVEPGQPVNWSKLEDVWQFRHLNPYQSNAVFTSFLFLIIQGLMFTSVGPLLIIAGYGLVILMVAGLGLAVMLYLTAMMALVITGMLFKLILMLVMIAPATARSMFDYLIQLIIGYILLAAIVVGFLSVMITIMMHVALSEDGLVVLFNKAVAGEGMMEGSTSRYVNKMAVNFNMRLSEEGRTQETHSLFDDLGKYGDALEDFTRFKFFIGQWKFVDLSHLYLKRDGEEIVYNETELASFLEVEETQNQLITMKFTQQVLVMLLMAGLLFSFMVNVMTMGGQIVGLNADPVLKASSVYNAAVKTMSAAIK